MPAIHTNDSAPQPITEQDDLPTARWPWQRSLLLRVVLAYALMFTLVLGIMTWRVGQIIYNNQIDQAEHELEVEAFLAANALEDAQSGFIREFDNHSRFLNSIMRDENYLLGAWVVGDRSFVVDTETKLEEEEGSFALGGCAEVKLRQSSSGNIATEIESIVCRGNDTDTVINLFPDSERPLVIDDATLLKDAPAMPRLQQFAINYASDTDTRVTILDSWANVVADSHYPHNEIDNHLNQIEIQAALQDSEQHHIRPDPVSGEETLYVAAPINQNGRPLGLVRLGRSMALVTADSRNLLLGLIATSLIALLVTIGVGTLIGHRLVQPVRRLEQAALSLAKGDMTQHVPLDRRDELGALAHAFNHMVDELARMFKQQRLFIANASHELRTPLANIELRSDALLRNQHDPEISQLYLETISKETKRLGRLATDLLDLTKLERENNATQEAAPPPEPINIRPLLLDIWKMMEFRATATNITMTCNIPEDLPLLRILPEQLEVIVVNLLDNAIKYTPSHGHVTLSAKKLPPQKNSQNLQQRVQIHVRDTGPGIPEEDIHHIFEPFYRADKARSRRRDAQEGTGSGAGLGLSIIQTLVRKMGGVILIESTPGKGTLFIVEFTSGESMVNGRSSPSNRHRCVDVRYGNRTYDIRA